MWAGRKTLASIEDALSKLCGEQGQLDQALRSAVGETERLRSERSLGLRELARIKLDEMAAGRLVGNLDAGERRARQILDDYRLRITAAAGRNVMTTTTDTPTPAQILSRFGDTAYAIGRASSIHSFAGNFCAGDCGFPVVQFKRSGARVKRQ